jgi:4-hydroxy-tetrahydrodipicolinate synthase
VKQSERTLAHGILVPSLTVFHEDAKQSVDEVRTAAHVDWLIQQGVDAIIPAGSSGEFPALKPEEAIRIFQIAIETSNGRVPVYPAVGRYSTYETIELAYAAKSANADGIMVLPPYYMKPSQGEILEHYRAVASAVKLPIILYNNPATTGVEVSHETIVQLANEGVVHGVKSSQGTIAPTIQLVEHPRLSSYYGHDLEPWSALAKGAHGWFSLLPNAIPAIAKKLLASEAPQARQDAWRRIEPIAKFVWGGTAHPIAIVKAALELQNRRVGIPRLPLRPLSADGIKTLTELLKKAGVL